jgi:hypothetical protein
MESNQPYLCKISPTVLFQIIDYYERRLDNTRVIGTLLGSIDAGVVTLTNCYKVPHKEQEEEVAINMEFNMELYKLQRRVNTSEIIVGWFTTSKSIEGKDKLVNDYYREIMGQNRQGGKGGTHPIVLMMDTMPSSLKIDLKCYTPLTVEIGKRKVVAFMPLWLQTEIQYSDADRTIIDDLKKAARPESWSNRGVTIPTGIAPLTQTCDTLIDQLSVIQKYVEEVLSGKRRPNAATGRLLTDFFHSTPKADPVVFEKMLNNNVNDLLMVLYLGQLANVELALNEKLVLAQ